MLVAKYVIDPFANVLTHIVALKGFSESHDELVWVLLTPRRQCNIIDQLLVLPFAKIDLVQIQIQLRQVKEFWQDLSHIRVVAQGIQE